MWPSGRRVWLPASAIRFVIRQGDFAVADDIEAKIKAIVAEQLGVDQAEISRETSFVNDLNADSLDTVELVMEFEDEFDMSIPDEEAEKIQTVGQAIDFVDQFVKGKEIGRAHV